MPGLQPQHMSVIETLCGKVEDIHFSYFSLLPWAHQPSEAVIKTTYSCDWQLRYVEQQYHQIDPVVLDGMSHCRPFDWSELDVSTKQVRHFFSEAEEYGVGRGGFSVTASSGNNIRGLFSINSGMRQQEWAGLLRDHAQEITYFALNYHDMASARQAVDIQKLSKRERQVLYWSAHGKTAWEVGRILELSEGTVGFYLRRICIKLGAVNKSQAVALAIGQRLVDPFISEN